MKEILLVLMCIISLAGYAQENKESENYIKAHYVPIRETQDEDVTIKTRCLVMVTNDYIIPEGQTLRGFYQGNKFIFRVDLNYYSIDKYFVWDIKSPHPFRTIDQIKADEQQRKENKEQRKKEKAERKQNKTIEDSLYD